jgi:undecaprenyl-diphosphatase
MALTYLIVLAVVQGITEFLPISSSAHLILVPVFLGHADQGLALDLAVHAGSLLAVMLYFRQDTLAMARGGFDLLRGRHATADADLLLKLAIATVPVIIVGAFASGLVAGPLRSVPVIATTTILFGLLLGLADRRADRPAADVLPTRTQALQIGLAQVLALIPGVSRSGITMTAGLFVGLSRTATARFSMLLSIPTTAAAVFVRAVEVYRGDLYADPREAFIAATFAFVAAYAAIAWLMSWLRRTGFTIFVVYRVVLGLALFGWLWF